MNAIETHDLTKFYGKSRGIIDLDLSVKDGEIFGFIGPNGAGKSTTIRTLLNFIYPTKGAASIFGRDCVVDTREVKKLIGYIPAEVAYYDDMRVRDLLAYSAQFYPGDHTARARELAGLFEVELDRRIEALSTGNRRKVAIIQALQHRPKLLILDEPTSGLDPLMQARFFQVLEEENKNGTTVFFSSHILSEVQRLCHRVGIIKEGRLIRVEEVEKLRASRYKAVKVELSTPARAAAFVASAGGTGAGAHPGALPGADDLRAHGRVVEFIYRGKVSPLLSHLAALEPENVWLEEPSLEEIFMRYYGKEGN
ncbi:MAG: ABC transporter ATP-binding protein [Bacillota bacterium]